MRYLFTITTLGLLLLGAFPTAILAVLPAGCQPYDFNNDGTINSADVSAVSTRLGIQYGQLGYDIKFDLNKDGKIDSADLKLISACDPNQPPIRPDTSKISEVEDPLPPSVTDRGIGGILTNLFSSIIVLAGMVAVLVVIWGGFRYLTAQGDEKAVASARGTITGAVIGLIIILSVAVIGFLLNAVLKINVFNG